MNKKIIILITLVIVTVLAGVLFANKFTGEKDKEIVGNTTNTSSKSVEVEKKVVNTNNNSETKQSNDVYSSSMSKEEIDNVIDKNKEESCKNASPEEIKRKEQAAENMKNFIGQDYSKNIKTDEPDFYKYKSK